MINKTSLSLGESLDISQATSLHGRMLRALEKSSTIELKADAVQKADTAGLQLLLSLKKEVTMQGGEIIWKKPSKNLLDSAQLLGLFEHLGLHY